MADVIRKIKINGTERVVDAPPEMRLLDVMRGELRLMGTKEGCGEGECGACSVIIDGKVVNSCLKLFGALSDGDDVITVEGLREAGHLSPLQECFVEGSGTQCGTCTPGMLMAAHALLMKNADPTREDIKEGLSGNLCRCTGYVKIIDAVEKAAKKIRDSKLGTRNSGKK
jgi:carbon-monoxide dehydrogenase small subunit